MTGPVERVRRASRRLTLAVCLAAVTWAGIAAGCVVLLMGLLQLALPSVAVAGAPTIILATVAASGAAMWIWWRGRYARSPLRVALWIEERQRDLRYALVTVLDPGVANVPVAAELLQAANQAEIEVTVRRATRRLLGRAASWAALVGAGLYLAWRTLPGSIGMARPGASGSGPATGSRLTPLTAEVMPPGYSGLSPVRIGEPQAVTALAGSMLTLSSDGPPEGVAGVVGADTLRAVRRGNGWAITLRLGGEPGVIGLVDRTFHRLVSLEPQSDSVPAVTLTLPARDTTYRTLPSDPIVLEARATDDLGLASGHWEYLITSGAGEQFETVARDGPVMRWDGARNAILRATLRLDTLHLTPGSVLNLRAVVQDANDVTGPGRGVSDTRTLRLATLEDSSAAALEPPIPIDQMWISQRLLNLRTDTLVRDRRRMTGSVFADRAMSYSNTQLQIRERVLAVVALLEDDGVGGSAPTEESRQLRVAGEEMFAARIQLATALADSAQPHMRRALEILDEIRTARRYHLRGVVRPAPVDLARARLTGRERGAPATSGGLPPLEDSDRELAHRLERLVALERGAPEAARDSLVFLRAAVLRSRPVLARALAEALSRLRDGAPVEAALVPARLLLVAPPTRVTGTVEWTGGGEW